MTLLTKVFKRNKAAEPTTDFSYFFVKKPAKDKKKLIKEALLKSIDDQRKLFES